jgi:hypothetical protein
VSSRIGRPGRHRADRDSDTPAVGAGRSVHRYLVAHPEALVERDRVGEGEVNAASQPMGVGGVAPVEPPRRGRRTTAGAPGCSRPRRTPIAPWSSARFLVVIDKAVPADLDVHPDLQEPGHPQDPGHPGLARSAPRFHLHFVPTGSSWIKQGEPGTDCSPISSSTAPGRRTEHHCRHQGRPFGSCPASSVPSSRPGPLVPPRRKH